MANAILNITDNQGYSPDQVVENSITLADLLAAVEQVIEEVGAEAKVVLSNGQRYGAGYGNISQWEDIFTVEGDEEE